MTARVVLLTALLSTADAFVPPGTTPLRAPLRTSPTMLGSRGVFAANARRGAAARRGGGPLSGFFGGLFDGARDDDRASSAWVEPGTGVGEDCNIAKPAACASSETPAWLSKLADLQDAGVGSVALMLATVVSLSLANMGGTSAGWLAFLGTPVGPTIGGHALSPRAWVNEGLMSLFFFVVGLEIKHELRHGSLSSVKKALLPCIAAVGGMITPMLIYFLVQGFPAFAGGSMAALTVPMATDIAFAMAIFGFFRSTMPPSASIFLLTLATVDDLGAIFVLATCFAANVQAGFLALGAAITGWMAWLGSKQVTDIKPYAFGGTALWWCLLRAGVSADVSGVIAALCLSTRAFADDGERVSEKLITWLAPLSTFFIMPVFALCNTAVPLKGLFSSGASVAQTVGPAAGIAAGLLLGKPLGIFGATWLATKLGVANMPEGMNNSHLGVVSVLGAIGFTMCLLLTEVAMPTHLQPIPKLAVMLSSAVACIVSAAWMSNLAKSSKENFSGQTSAFTDVTPFSPKPA